jgi:hypothetical protein
MENLQVRFAADGAQSGTICSIPEIPHPANPVHNRFKKSFVDSKGQKQAFVVYSLFKGVQSYRGKEPHAMNQKLTSIDTLPAPKPETATPPRKRRLRRQIDSGQFTGPNPSFLLNHEDAAALQTLRQSVQDRLGARVPIEIVAAEFATAAAWHGIRALNHLGSVVDTEVLEQSEAVDREFDEIDPVSRTALIYHDAATAHILRGFERTIQENHRVIRHIFPMKALKTRN